MASKRGRRCTICDHEQRAEIERAIAEQQTQSAIAARFGLTPRMVQHHAGRHIPLAMAAAAESGAVVAPDRQQVDILAGERMLAHIQMLYARSMRVLNAAEGQGKLGIALGAIQQARECLTLLARMAGELNEGAQVNVALIQSPEWEQARAALLRALEPFADARVAAARALLTLEEGRDVGE